MYFLEIPKRGFQLNANNLPKYLGGLFSQGLCQLEKIPYLNTLIDPLHLFNFNLSLAMEMCNGYGVLPKWPKKGFLRFLGTTNKGYCRYSPSMSNHYWWAQTGSNCRPTD